MSPPGYGIGPFAVQAAPDAAQGSETNPPFERVETLTLSPGEDQLSSMVIDPAGEFAYLGTTAVVVKVDLATFERVDVLPASSARAGIIGPTGEYAYVDPDGRYAYFGAFPGPSFHPFLGLQGTPARVIKVDLETFERVGAIVLADGVRSFKAATVDPAGEFAYFGDVIADPGLVVKVRIGAADTDLPGALTPLQPSRLLDTRQPGGTTIDGQFQADGVAVRRAATRRVQPELHRGSDGPERRSGQAVTGWDGVPVQRPGVGGPAGRCQRLLPVGRPSAAAPVRPGRGRPR